MSYTECQWPDPEMADHNDQIAIGIARERVRVAELEAAFARGELHKIERRPHAARCGCIVCVPPF